MKVVKKSFNLPQPLVDSLEQIVEANPGSTLTFVVVQALENWLVNPTVRLATPSANEKSTASESRIKKSDARDSQGIGIETGN